MTSFLHLSSLAYRRRFPATGRRCALVTALVIMLAPGQSVAQTAVQPVQPAQPAISRAETLLFETDHLARIKPPAVLVYDFRKVSNVEPGFSDKVQLDLATSKGKTSATLHFLSGAHRKDIPALENAHGNPVLLGFLERDIAEMKRLTGGSPAYFRKRIRMALAEGAQVSAQSILYQGKSLPAQAVRIQPYLHDPLHARFEPYVHKTYVFIVSAQVPGGVYQLRSSLRNATDGQGGTVVAGAASANTMAASGMTAARMSTASTPAAGKPGAGGPTVGTPALDTPLAAAQTHSVLDQQRAASPAQAAPGTGKPLPAIDETLTLVSMAQPGR